MKVYVVEQGEYSDRNVIGICSTKAKAKKLVIAKTCQYLGVPDITEWELDVMPVMPKGKLPFNVKMDVNGNSQVTRRSTDGFYESCQAWGDDVHYSFCVWAKDEKHAVKIANEKRTQMIARNEWKPRRKLLEHIQK